MAPVVSFETRPHAFGLGQGLHEGAVEEPLRKGADGDGVLTLHVPQVQPRVAECLFPVLNIEV